MRFESIAGIKRRVSMMDKVGSRGERTELT